ncbi:MAG: RsmB/NOP family class I SAM-dependent RNA methyltransferase [Verrucomicrobia bacterium]|nr:RsmB/NOP family class I SAM-dependent RNA methyltransferase [Verrucomicrobiota bacterium]MBU1910551.1 RsmB/NOP family class I SAM-dependent RNA methyltransferase [Verrucomicrobiota bacterium]
MNPTVQPVFRPDVAAHLAARAVALMRIIADAVDHGEPADAALNRFFRAHKECGSRDRRFLGDVVFSYFRWKGWMEQAPLEKACALAWGLDAAAAHPVGAALLQSAGRSPGELSPSGLLPLREKAARAARWLDLPASPEIEDLVPRWVPDTLATEVYPFIEAVQQRPPTWLRARRGDEKQVLLALHHEGMPAVRHPVLKSALSLPGSSPLNRLAAESRSRFEVQDLASQCVGLVSAPQPGESWWDVCAGAGGKTLHLADLMNNRGRILATDVRTAALHRLRRRAGSAGHSLIRIAAAGAPVDEVFHGVLVDAPCSGLGTWSRNPDARWRTSPGDIKRRATQQLEILAQAASRVKPGGCLVYAVCTLTLVETLEITIGFLRAHSAFSLDPVPHPLTGQPTDGRLWIQPQDGPCDGMYIARFRRRQNL